MAIQMACKFSETLILHSSSPEMVIALKKFLSSEYDCFEFRIQDELDLNAREKMKPFVSTDACLHVFTNSYDNRSIPTELLYSLRNQAHAFWVGASAMARLENSL